MKKKSKIVDLIFSKDIPHLKFENVYKSIFQTKNREWDKIGIFISILSLISTVGISCIVQKLSFQMILSFFFSDAKQFLKLPMYVFLSCKFVADGEIKWRSQAQEEEYKTVKHFGHNQLDLIWPTNLFSHASC